MSAPISPAAPPEAAPQDAVDDQARAHAHAGQQEDDVVGVARRPLPALGQREVDFAPAVATDGQLYPIS
ncbi:hypothetical protein ACIA5D_07655 [Actinoplanes sp. NPDC051513]|uniref:hypothetical protein n=1 Tax=Actinoplanes sp. NPDC051513 TaxID=3363908 RepID=UPI0037AB730B